jgi:hypothetical protein
LHAGLIVIVPNVTPARQRELFHAVLEHAGSRQLINTLVEVRYAGNGIECVEFALPERPVIRNGYAGCGGAGNFTCRAVLR